MSRHFFFDFQNGTRCRNSLPLPVAIADLNHDFSHCLTDDLSNFSAPRLAPDNTCSNAEQKEIASKKWCCPSRSRSIRSADWRIHSMSLRQGHGYARCEVNCNRERSSLCNAARKKPSFALNGLSSLPRTNSKRG